jgi:hypothetical protein
MSPAISLVKNDRVVEVIEAGDDRQHPWEKIAAQPVDSKQRDAGRRRVGARLAALFEQRIGVLAGEASFEIVEIRAQFGAWLLRFLEFAAHPFDVRVERFELLRNGVANLLQRFARKTLGAVDRVQAVAWHFGDAFQRKAGRAQTQDEAEPLQVFLVVEPVAGLAAGGRHEAAFLVVLQCARRDAEAFGGVADGQQGA